MKNFVYYRPKTAEDAVALLDSKWGPTELLAGGTDLLDLQKEYVAQPDKVISLRDVGGKITSDGDAVKIEAMSTLAAIADHADVNKSFPSLAVAAGDAGGPQIRNMGTLGGNPCQRNPGWDFRN